MCQWKYNTRTALFWAITQQAVVIPYRRFGTTYLSHLQGSRIWILGPWKRDLLVVPKHRYGITTTRYVIGQKNAVLLYFAADVWNRRRIKHYKARTKLKYRITDYTILINGPPKKCIQTLTKENFTLYNRLL